MFHVIHEGDDMSDNLKDELKKIYDYLMHLERRLYDHVGTEMAHIKQDIHHVHNRIDNVLTKLHTELTKDAK